MVAALLAALKSGSPYVPLDVNYPPNRLRDMLEHSDSEVLLTDRKNLRRAEELAGDVGRKVQTVVIDALDESDVSEPLRGERRADRPAYILYTSGSTGWPKGVAQSEENVFFFIKHWSDRVSLAESDRVALFASLSHDASIPDIYGALLNGASLYPFDIRRQGGFQRLEEWLLEERITIWHSVPTLYRRFAESLQVTQVFPDLRWVVLGGEEVREHDVLLFRRHFPGARFANLYGQTESTINSVWTLSPKDPFGEIIIGDPVGDTQVLLVDEEDRIVEGSGTGEVVIVSEHVALGYWKDEEAGNHAFTRDEELGRLYWTGDLGRLSIDGGISIVGRKDVQVKVRGYRVELGEIENTLVRYEGVRDAIVVARPNARGESDLNAYFTSDRQVEAAELRDFLSAQLPDYMLPLSFTRLDEMPLTPNGKIDRKRLAGHDFSPAQRAVEFPPQTDTQRKIAAVWQNVLGTNEIDVRSTFFELGGHSILMISLISMLHLELRVELRLQDLFRYQTVEQLAEYVDSIERRRLQDLERRPDSAAPQASILPVGPREYYPVSETQKEVYRKHQLYKSKYHREGTLHVLEGRLDIARFEQAFQSLIDRHEPLRTSFHQVGGQIVQRVHDRVEFNLPFQKCDVREVEERMRQFIRPFNLEDPPLFRVEVLQVAEQTYYMLFDIHHIIYDDDSMQLLLADLDRFYRGETPPPLAIQYKDYAAWEGEAFEKGLLDQAERYWLDTLVPFSCTELPWSNLSDFSGRYAIEDFFLDANTCEAADRVCVENGCTRLALLMAAFSLALGEETGNGDVSVGLRVSTRSGHQLQDMVGPFFNKIVIRSRVETRESFAANLSRVKATLTEAMENAFYPYDLLKKKLKSLTAVSSPELFRIIINYLRVEAGSATFLDPQIAARPVYMEVPMAAGSIRYQLMLTIFDNARTMSLRMVFGEGTCDREQIRALFSRMKGVILSAVEELRPLKQI
jgi:amino acid adenylation domain-containing protein